MNAKRKILATGAALSLLVAGVFTAATASAVDAPPGSSPDNPIVLDSPDDAPKDAVTDGPYANQCATEQTWTLTGTYKVFRYSREVEGVPLYKWTREQDRSATNVYTPGTDATYQHAWDQYTREVVYEYEYIKQVQGVTQRSWLGLSGWKNVGTFGWENWSGGSTQWSEQNVPVLDSGSHNAVQAEWWDGSWKYRKVTTSYQYVRTATPPNPVGHTEWVKSSPSPFGYGDVVPEDSDLVRYEDLGGDFVKDAATPGSWSGWTPMLDFEHGWTGDEPTVPDVIVGSGTQGPLTWTQHRKQTMTSATKPDGNGWVQGEQDGWLVEPGTEFYVSGGDPSRDEDKATWLTEDQDPGEGWTVFDEDVWDGETTHYFWTDGVECALDITETLACGTFDVTVDHNTPWRYGVTVEVDGEVVDSNVVIGEGSDTIALTFDEDSSEGEADVRYYVTDATEWDLVPADLNYQATWPKVGDAFREFTVNTNCLADPEPAAPATAHVVAPSFTG